MTEGDASGRRREENVRRQDAIFSEKAIRQQELFDFGETFNDVTLQLTTYYHYRKIFDRILRSGADAVLELGCHTGKNLRYLAEKRPGVRTFGLDISRLSLRKARTNNVHGTGYLAGSADRLPFRDRCMDVVLCMDLLEHLDDPSACLQESARVLRAGGRLAIKCPVNDNQWTLDGWYRRRDPDAWRKGLLEVGHAEERLLDTAELVRRVEQAGLRVVKKIRFDLWIQNIYDYRFLPRWLPMVGRLLRRRPLRAAPRPQEAEEPAPLPPPADPGEAARLRARLRRRIAVKRWAARFVIPAVRALCLPERLASRLGIGATVYIVAEKIPPA